jgi:hypothetical protein
MIILHIGDIIAPECNQVDDATPSPIITIWLGQTECQGSAHRKVGSLLRRSRIELQGESTTMLEKNDLTELIEVELRELIETELDQVAGGLNPPSPGGSHGPPPNASPRAIYEFELHHP